MTRSAACHRSGRRGGSIRLPCTNCLEPAGFIDPDRRRSAAQDRPRADCSRCTWPSLRGPVRRRLLRDDTATHRRDPHQPVHLDLAFLGAVVYLILAKGPGGRARSAVITRWWSRPTMCRSCRRSWPREFSMVAAGTGWWRRRPSRAWRTRTCERRGRRADGESGNRRRSGGARRRLPARRSRSRTSTCWTRPTGVHRRVRSRSMRSRTRWRRPRPR